MDDIQPVQGTVSALGERAEIPTIRHEESHAHGSVDISGSDLSGNQEPKENPGKIEEREQVVLGSVYCNGSAGIQDTMDPGGLGFPVEGEIDGHEATPRLPFAMEIISQVKIEKPKKSQPLVIIVKPLHSDNGSSSGVPSEGGIDQETSRKGGLLSFPPTGIRPDEQRAEDPGARTGQIVEMEPDELSSIKENRDIDRRNTHESENERRSGDKESWRDADVVMGERHWIEGSAGTTGEKLSPPHSTDVQAGRICLEDESLDVDNVS